MVKHVCVLVNSAMSLVLFFPNSDQEGWDEVYVNTFHTLAPHPQPHSRFITTVKFGPQMLKGLLCVQGERRPRCSHHAHVYNSTLTQLQPALPTQGGINATSFYPQALRNFDQRLSAPASCNAPTCGQTSHKEIPVGNPTGPS